MTQVNDELALREALAEMTAGQPAAPPDRYSAVRRRAVLQRRRRLAGIAAAVAVLAAAAVTIPLGLRHPAAPVPQARSRHYHVTELRPGPSSAPGLVATGTVNGKPWRVASAYYQSTGIGECITNDAGHMNCDDSPDLAWRRGDPAYPAGSLGSGVYYWTARSDVAYLQIVYGNGQILAAYPVPVLSARYAPVVAFAAPYPAAVTKIIAFSAHGELGYAIPFTRAGDVDTGQWLRPGEAPQPAPATYAIGSGAADGHPWHERVYVGPWGICYEDGCDAVDWLGHQQVAGIGSTTGTRGTWAVLGQTAPQVALLVVTTADGQSDQIRPVSDGVTGLFAYLSVHGDPVVRWAAYDTHGRKLASGHGFVP
jgi:hypothetical protein